MTSVDGGMIWGMSTAYAAETHEYTETATSIHGLEGTDKTHSMNDNKITLGTEGGPTDKPFSTWRTISGGGKKNATEDVSNNILTIHGLKVSNGSGQSMIYGGISGTGAVTNNRVLFNNGLSKDPIYGGFNGASATKAVTGNTVTVAGGTVEGDVQGGGTAGTGTVTGNSITLKGGTFGDEAMGGIIRNASSSADVTGNTVTIAGGRFTRNNTFVHGGYTQGAGKTTGNTVNLGDGENAMASGTDLTKVNLVGGNKSDDVTGNTLNVNASGIIARTAQNFEKYNFNLTKGVTVGTDNSSILNNTMLKLTEGSAFGNTRVQWKNITLNAEKWHDDKTRYGKIGTVQMLWGGAGSSLKVYHDAVMDRTATSGDFEYHMYTDVSTPPFGFFGYNVLTYIRADINRFQNADATADSVTGMAVYGGYSSLGNTTTNNKIKITNTNNTNLTVYGGYTAGAGDSTNNHVTITTTGKVKAAYGGYATAANGKAEDNSVTVEQGGWVDDKSYAGQAKDTVNRNIFTVKGHADWSVTGGLLDGSGTAEGNEVRIESGMVKGYATGAIGGAGSTVTSNKVTLTGGTVKKNISGGQVSGANGKATKNTVSITNGSTAEGIVNGGHMTGDGTVSGNEVTIAGSTVKNSVNGGYSSASGTVTGNKVTVSGSSTLEMAVYGGYADTAGTVTANIVDISGGTFKKRVFGGYSDKHGTVTGNKVTITGGTFQDHVYGGAGGDNNAAYTAQNFAANNNTVTIAGGTFSGNIYGGVSWKTNGTATGNTVNLGDAGHTDLSGTTLTNADIYGGKYSGNGTGTGDYVTGNTLNVNAKNIKAKSVNSFENYKFKLNSATAFGDTMLTVTNAGAFTGMGVDWNKLTVDRAALSDVSNLHGIRRVTLLKRSNAADTLKFQNYAAQEIGTATDTHEFGLVTDTDTDEANAALFEVSRFKGSEVVYNGTTEVYQGASGSEIYGGLSRYGHTTTGNKLTITGLKGANDPKYAFGGINKGATGDVKNNTLNIDLANAGAVIDEAYAGEAENANNAGEVSGNVANMKKGTVNKLYGGHTFGKGAVKDNVMNFSGGTSTNYVAGGYVDNDANVTDVTGNNVVFTGGTAKAVEGGASKGTGALKNNSVAFSGAASTADTLRGAKSEKQKLVEANTVTVSGGTVKNAYGAETSGGGEAKKNTVTISGGTVNAEVAGGVGYKATENTVTLTGGTVSGDVYGGKSAGPGSSTSGNIVNLGAEDGTYTADLTNAALYGDNNSGTGATLNVRAKNITAKSADKFENYKFHLNDDIAKNGGSMLTLTENNGFNGGNLLDWTKLDVDTSKLSGSTVIGKATLLTGTANGLKFTNYAGRNKTTAATNGDYETALRTDTNAATATKVILDYNRFQNNANATYDGSIPPTQLADGSTEVYGGISYAGNTTKNNHLTITNLQADLDFAYGGKTVALTGNTENNSVTVTGTGSKKIKNINGGYTGATNGTASANRVLIKGGTVTNVMGGAVSGANGSATDNEVTVEGGTVTNVIGGGGSATAAGNMSNNRITITGGTVTGQIVGGDSRVLTSTSNNNTITLGGGTLTGSQVWGTSYGGTVLANTDAKIAGNTLNVKAKDGVTLKKVRNVEKFHFQIVDDTTKTAPLLNLTEAGGFGKVTADNSDVKVKWSNVTANMSKVTTEADAAKIQGKNTYILMRAADPTLKFSDYAARYDTYGGVYETGLRTNTNTDMAQEVLYDVNRFKDGRVTYTTTSTGEALGGYSAFGSTTEGNELTLTGVTGTLAAAYGGQTAGVTGDSANNKVTLKGTGTGSIVNVYGGAITKAANSGNATGNTVTLTGGTVTGAVYGGYTEGSGKTTGNTVNIGDGTAATLAAGTNLANAMLAGGNKSEMTGNTLNVMVKDAAAKKAQNFENYTFHLTDHIAADKPKSGVVDDAFTKSRGTMLTLAEGFDGQTADWSKVTVDTSKLSADKTLGAITLMKSTAANKLKFSNYAAKNHAVSGDYEVVQRTDTNTSEANAVLIDVNRFRNGDVTYHNGDNNAKTYAGVSYGGNTAEGNKFTLKGISEGKTLKYVSGGRSEGTAGGAVKNTVNLLGTGKGTLEEVYGGYVGNAANAADVTENTVNITGGTAKNVYGGYTRGTGKTVKNTVNIGYTDEAGVFHDVADGAKITGTIYGGSGSDATGNVLNVSGKIAAGNIKNFESVKFHVRDTMASGTTLLTLDGAAATEGLDWANVTLDEFKPVVKSYEAYRLTLMANEKGIDFRKGGVDTYAPIGAKGVTKGDYEAVLDTDTHVAQAKAVNAEIYRFRNNEATYTVADGAHDAAWGGRSHLGNDATGNTLTISGGTLKDAYGGWSTGKKADGTLGKTTGNTVNFTGGTVTGTIYGGSNGAAGNTLNVTGTQSAGDIKNFEKLHFDTSMAKAGDTILMLNGGKKTTGLDWQKVEAADLDEASLATRTGVAREELFSLMANDKGIDFGTTYDKAKEKTVGDYEYVIAKEADAAKGAAAEKVVVRGFRFQNNADAVYETGDNKAAWGGRSIIGNTVQRNKLTVKGGTLTEAAYGGLSAKGVVTGNTLVLAGGTLKNAYGGFVEGAGDATKNTVEVQKDTQAQIYGGYAAQGEASGNILNLGAVNIGANVYGGSGKKTDGNVINLFGTKIKGTVTGGTAADGKANVLAIRAAGTEIGDFKGIQNLKFYLPEGAKSSMATMLRLGVKDKDIKGLNVDLNLSGAAKTLKREDVFSLMKVAEGGTLTTDEKIKGEVTGTQGVSLDYKFRVQKKGADELIAAVESVKMKDATKSLAETRTTATDVLGGGMTMIADAGVSAAVQAAASANANAQVEAAPMATNKAPSAKAASAANVQSGAYTAWAAQGGSSMRIHSGSYVDTHGYTLNVGFARKQDGKDSTLTFGPFVEYGRASYDSYLEDAAGTHGSGKVSYIGAGVLARQDLKSGLYLEGSVRGGRIKSDYEGNISGTSTSYDISNPYYAIHLGVGKETKLKAGDALETYLKYFFSHQNGTSGKLSTGEDYDFDAVNSHRLRLGARYTHDMGEEGKFYAGLAWEYEFNGEARATYQGMATPSPSLKGGSAMLELGYRFTPKKSRVSYDVNFSGWQGKREGFSGSVGVNWAF
ncbi:autotransporter outer membrane beta-barrel domain-containing protein [uncultured Selenomonas sp.]|uniref:autotransporter outer membrane beta-barrel domain-containing protein n=1 Tax=uncultured Selenomonas sp. TaxID=159275 RepID=UPI0028D4B4EB|nr:autotransporter outer membrane beta-barrel domain-containing protein [uncultured Selenomonas sp.]